MTFPKIIEWFSKSFFSFCEILGKWAKDSVFIYPIFLSLIAALIFWLVFSYYPERKRHLKLRPIVELCLFECYQSMFALFDKIMAHRQNSPSYFQRSIRSGQLSNEEIRLGLQNKCLNDSYLYDAEVKDHLLVIGEDIYCRSMQIEQYANKIIGYSPYTSAGELILLEKIVHELQRYDHGEQNVKKSAMTMVGGQTLYPTVPVIYYRAKNFSDLYQCYCSLQKMILEGFSALNRDHTLNKVQYLFYSGQYKKCRSFINRTRGLPEYDVLFLKCYLALCERSLGNYAKFYKMIEDIFGERPYEGGLVYSRGWLSEFVNDKKLMELLAKFHAKEEIAEFVRVVAEEAESKKRFISTNRQLSEYFAAKDTRLSPVGPV